MQNVKDLLTQRDEILSKIREIEENCEGIDNEHNAKKITELNMGKSNLISKKNNISAELSKIEQQLNKINEDIKNLSGKGIDRILEAIKEQRWYYFKNKPKVLMDRNTGLIWANPNYFKVIKNESSYKIDEAKEIVENLIMDGHQNWKIPNEFQFCTLIDDITFPEYTGNSKQIFGNSGVILNYNEKINYIWTDNDYPKTTDHGVLFPTSEEITYQEYESNVSSDNNVYTEVERLQFTLNLFVNNNLEPIFNNNEITELYKKIYFEKPVLMKKLNELQEQINDLQQEVLLSSTFDYNILLVKYDIKAIDNSIIKYYEAVINWTDELMDKMRYYEGQKSDVIRDCNIIGLTLSKKYDNNPNLTDKENELLKSRQVFFKKHFELGMNSVSSKLLAIKKQSEKIEERIEEINNGDNAIEELAKLEDEKRASFRFIAENTSNIIKNALIKIEYFEKNRDFATNAVKLWDEWTEDYKVFKTTKKDELKNICEEDSIEENIWQGWYADWNKSRFIIEKQFLPLIEKGLKGKITTNKLQGYNENQQQTVIGNLIGLLEEYKEKFAVFYLEERKGIYQKFAFQAGGEVQEKFEAESELYKITTNFQKQLQEVIFSLDNVEDRLFLLNWANNIIDLQIDEILDFIKDKDLDKISKDVLNQFADLKRKNYDVYISDAKAYAEELARREKEYNSLIFKMRKDLMK
ncbi:MAG: hypothetical protein LLF98_07960 [Clostridium sp.]|uniref:hypothetical protein n=1 Tax=Clostridium sp. TaxID=1506 RepID=UPI0025C231A7|nr:hypothetical protein [Clostridium sp.]MCE5221190.1 hypothetical protein [Clostridium sp.]